MNLFFWNRLALMRKQIFGICAEYFPNPADHESPLSTMQQTENQSEQHTHQNRRAKRKVKREIVALVMEIKRKAPDPERQPRSEHKKYAQQREHASRNQEQTAELLHGSIMRENERG